jgi:hypothetical protein
MDAPADAGAVAQLRETAGAEVMLPGEVKRNNRRTATLLWLIVAGFFFGVMIKYYLLAR